MMKAAAKTDVGRQRDGNEDTCLVDDELGLFIVCDGMGGHQAGEVASQLALDAVLDVVTRFRSEEAKSPSGGPDATANALRACVREAVGHACRVVHSAARRDRKKAGMGCTLTMLLVSGPKAVMGHVGDTRLYLIRDGAAHQLSTDHTMAAELARAGMITPDQVQGHAMSNVLTQCIGQQEAVSPDILAMDVLPGDRFLICSDGLSDYIDDDADLSQRIAGLDLHAMPASLVAFANEAGGKDNISVIVVEADPGGASGAALERARATRRQIRALADSPFFDDEFFSHLLRLMGTAEVQGFDEGEELVSIGQMNSALYLPVTGYLRVTDAKGRSRDVMHGEAIGETTLFHPRQARAAITAHDECKALVLNAAGLKRLIQRYPWFGIGVLERLAAHLSERLNEASVPEDALTL